jgi:hypothetical protein
MARRPHVHLACELLDDFPTHFTCITHVFKIDRNDRNTLDREMLRADPVRRQLATAPVER